LGIFFGEEEAARAYDHMSIWCMIHGKTKEGGYKLNFDRSDYADEEEELRVVTQVDLMKRLQRGKAVSVVEEEAVGSGDAKSGRGQKRKNPLHSEDDDNAADDGDEEAEDEDDDSGEAYVEDDDKEEEEEKEEEKDGDDVEKEDGSDTSGGSDTGGGSHHLAAELSTSGHINAATVTTAKGMATICAEMATIADQENARLCAINNVELGDAICIAQVQAAASAAAQRKERNELLTDNAALHEELLIAKTAGQNIFAPAATTAIAIKDNNDLGSSNGVGGGRHVDWTSGAGIASGDCDDAGGGGGGNGGSNTGGGSAHKIVVKIERIEGVPQAMCTGTGQAEPHGASSDLCGSAGEGGNSSLREGGAEGDAQHHDSLAVRKPATSAVTDGAFDDELQMTEAAPVNPTPYTLHPTPYTLNLKP
jgi:hypothetical protein